MHWRARQKKGNVRETIKESNIRTQSGEFSKVGWGNRLDGFRR